MNGLCGANCADCGFGKQSGCCGCEASGGCPQGVPCFIAQYIKTGGKEAYDAFVGALMDDINALNIPGMPTVTQLFALLGGYVNLAYPMPNGQAVTLLDDRAVYLGCQLCSDLDDGENDRCFGVVANADFILVATYGVNGADPELVAFRKR